MKEEIYEYKWKFYKMKETAVVDTNKIIKLSANIEWFWFVMCLISIIVWFLIWFFLFPLDQ